MNTAQRSIAVLGLIVLLGNMIFPPTRVIGRGLSTGGYGVASAVKRMPIWADPPDVIVPSDDYSNWPDGVLSIFPEEKSVDTNGLIVPSAIILVATLVIVLLLGGSKPTPASSS